MTIPSSQSGGPDQTQSFVRSQIDKFEQKTTTKKGVEQVKSGKKEISGDVKASETGPTVLGQTNLAETSATTPLRRASITQKENTEEGDAVKKMKLPKPPKDAQPDSASSEISRPSKLPPPRIPPRPEKSVKPSGSPEIETRPEPAKPPPPQIIETRKEQFNKFLNKTRDKLFGKKDEPIIEERAEIRHTRPPLPLHPPILPPDTPQNPRKGA